MFSKVTIKIIAKSVCLNRLICYRTEYDWNDFYSCTNLGYFSLYKINVNEKIT